MDGKSDNPYQPPRTVSSQQADDDGRVVAARYEVRSDLVKRCLRFEIERRTWLRQAAFLGSSFLLMAILFVVISEWPFWVGLSLLTAFVLLNLLSLILPDLYLWYWVRRGQPTDTARVEVGDYMIEVSQDAISWRINGRWGERTLADLRDAFYLGDLLLVFPVSEVAIPIPSTADFGHDSFTSFCRTFALRLRAQLAQGHAAG